MKKRPVKLVFPLDVPTEKEGRELAKEVGPYVQVMKVGLELEKNIGTSAMIDVAKSAEKEVFADVKLPDIPNTTEGAGRGLVRLGVDYYNVMASASFATIKAAVFGAHDEAAKIGIKAPKVISVLLLTSETGQDLVQDGFFLPPPEDATWQKLLQNGFLPPLKEAEKVYTFYNATGLRALELYVVARRAQKSVLAGVDCLLTSPLENQMLRFFYPEIEILNPGIRPVGSKIDDQKRMAPPGLAVLWGADDLVIGRPIRKPDGMTREQSLENIWTDITANGGYPAF
jgi:orotidine-5'-phosphate decarboxylase